MKLASTEEIVTVLAPVSKKNFKGNSLIVQGIS